MATDFGPALIALAAALNLGITAWAAAVAEKEIGMAAIGAAAEKPELFGKGLIMVVIPETIVIFGLVISILIIGLAN